MNKILIIDDDRELCALIKHSVQSEHIAEIKRAGIPACGAGCDDARYGWL